MQWRRIVSTPSCRFLADRTNDRAYAAVLCPSVCLSVTYVLWLNGASCRKTVWRSK